MEGYAEKKKETAKMLRIASYRIHQSLVEKPLSLTEYWPIQGETEQRETIVIDQETIDYIKKIHNVK